MPYSVLIVDDEALTLRTLGRALGDEGFEVFLAMSGEDALKILADEKPDFALLDVVLPAMNGIEVLRQAKVSSPNTIILMMSAYHMVDRAVEAMKLGAYDYLIKPFHIDDMVNTLRRAAEMLALRVRVHDTVQSAKGLYDFGRVVTQSPVMREVLEMARRAADSERTTILIQGESGTGKEVLAKAIHYNSPRAQMPLISLNCAALPDTLLESELFGYEPGAFTDARRRKEGLIEKASGGTLFLDEIGNTSPSLQAKLLRVLEEGTFMRLGGTKVLQADVRIITATNTMLKDAVAKAEFREDLYYRLNVLPPVHSSSAGTQGRRCAARARLHGPVQQGTEETLRRLYAGGGRAAQELPVAGQHPRVTQRDRTHHDPLQGDRDRCHRPSRRGPRSPGIVAASRSAYRR